MPGCPFGFGAEDAEDIENDHEEGCECCDWTSMSVEPDSSLQPMPVEGSDNSEADTIPDMCPGSALLQPPTGTCQRKPPKKKKKKAGSAFDKDPHEWFSSLGIKSEAEFQARKADLQAEARRRLAGLEEAKAKLRELDPDADSDSDISEFDDDMNSLHSISSTARKWATEANFKGPALLWIKGLSPVAVVASLYCLYTSSITMAAFVKVAGVVQNTQWAATCFTLASLSVLSTVLLYFAADWRSKKMMLSSQLALLVVYAMGTFVVALMVMQPTKIDTRFLEHACSDVKRTEGRELSRMCKMLPDIAKSVSETMPVLLNSTVVVTALSLCLIVLSIWYTYELTYIEKKGTKHKKRAQRTHHSIPWSKIKVRDAAAATAEWVDGGEKNKNI